MTPLVNGTPVVDVLADRTPLVSRHKEEVTVDKPSHRGPYRVYRAIISCGRDDPLINGSFVGIFAGRAPLVSRRKEEVTVDNT